MYKKLAEFAEDLQSDYVTIELEARMLIQKPINFIPDYEKTISYYRSTRYPSVTFRKYDNKIESKEVVENIKIGNITLALSVEQSYINSDIKFPLIKTNTRKIYRQIIKGDPNIEITRCDNEFSLEIEFNILNYHKVPEIIKEWTLPYWPCPKPMEISSTNLAKKLSNNQEWCISVKADGKHILLYIGDGKKVMIHDSGLITDMDNKECEPIIPKHIYEGELMENNEILIFDCLMHNQKNISKLDYIKRRRYINGKKKEIIIFNSVYGIKNILYEPHKFKTDGYIITNIRDRSLVYKSKFVSTVDLKYKEGYLYLENEIKSDRTPKSINYNFKEERIYEFDLDMNLVRERDDKSMANYKFPYDNNPIYKVVFGIGVPSLRYFHNKIKTELLSKLPKSSLLDIGSAQGGDIDKWINLKIEKVYAVDPNLKLRKHSRKIIEINDYVKNIPNDLNFNSVSILFVPWDDSFIDIINRANNLVISCMSQPKNYQCEIFKCDIYENKLTLEIPGTNTSEYVTENIVNYKKIFKSLEKNGWKHTTINRKMTFGTSEEKELSYMYSYHYFNRI